MMKIKSKILKILGVVAIFLFAYSCNKKEETKFIDQTTGKQESIKVIRFDRELFAVPKPNMEEFLKNLQTRCPEMFSASMEDKEYLQMIERFITDEYLLDAQDIVQRNYADLSFLEKDLTMAFANLQKHSKGIKLPQRLFSMILGPAEYSYVFENRCYTNGDYSAIALDIYSFPQIEKNPYYNTMPQYMTATLNKDYIASDFMRMYLKNVIYINTPNVQMNPDCTLLDAIIDEGKYSYITQNILPSYSLHQILRYTNEQLQWCEDNEKVIWAYIIENRLLYEKDRSKYMSLTAEAPTSKPLSDSPARVGHYIGYKIVKNFMDKEKISFDSLMHLTDSQGILKKSNYKPAK